MIREQQALDTPSDRVNARAFCLEEVMLTPKNHRKALPSSDLATQNLAVCLFYTGKVDETLELLEQLVEKGRSFHALTFNLVRYHC